MSADLFFEVFDEGFCFVFVLFEVLLKHVALDNFSFVFDCEVLEDRCILVFNFVKGVLQKMHLGQCFHQLGLLFVEKPFEF